VTIKEAKADFGFVTAELTIDAPRRSATIWPSHQQGSGSTMRRTLIVIGIVIVIVGLLWPWLVRIGFGRLPGDIVIRRESFTFYAPITTAILASVALSIVLWFINR
jgi:hypothetical protein